MDLYHNQMFSSMTVCNPALNSRNNCMHSAEKKGTDNEQTAVQWTFTVNA